MGGINPGLLTGASTEDNQTNGDQKTQIVDSSGNVFDNPISSDLEGGGKVAVGTTAVEVTFAGSTKSVVIRADKDNTGLLFIGESNVTNLGANAFTYLEAGDVLTIDYDDTTNGIYVVSDTVAQNFWKGAAL